MLCYVVRGSFKGKEVGGRGNWGGVRAGVARKVFAQRPKRGKEGAIRHGAFPAKVPDVQRVLGESLPRMFRKCQGGWHDWGSSSG